MAAIQALIKPSLQKELPELLLKLNTHTNFDVDEISPFIVCLVFQTPCNSNEELVSILLNGSAGDSM